MKRFYAKLKPCKTGYATDMEKLFEDFKRLTDDYVEWVNYPQKNAYVCQISVITRAKAHKEVAVKTCIRGNKVYLYKKGKKQYLIAEIEP